ncbi:hypothetical protein Agsp01_25240 [Agromyces sp. NBRC 114283]|nr:hypothetical protein Agsp01_25240 [Agromyces sp. NBRC 114283]
MGRVPLLVGRDHLRDRDRTRSACRAGGAAALIRYAGCGRYAVADNDNSQGSQPTTNTSSNELGGNANDTTIGFSREAAAQLAALDTDVTPEEQEAINALPSGSALLIVRRGPNSGARFLLDTEVTTVGRHPDADIFLDDVTVSRKHAEFVRHRTAFEVKDLSSLNGTYYDGVRIETALLADGAEVQIGKFRLTFYASRRDLVPASGE